MKLFEMTGLVSIVSVSDYEKSLTWYSKWLGEPDEIPMESMAEWKITADSWLQLDASNAVFDKANVVITVKDISDCRNTLIKVGIEVSEMIDYEVVQLCYISDPDGNRISFVQVIA